jgi:hypothetical protein
MESSDIALPVKAPGRHEEAWAKSRRERNQALFTLGKEDVG